MIIVLFVLGMAAASRAQFTDRYWCFGDSAGIDFSNLTNPVSGHSVLRARGTCASISDSSGNLLFYAGSPYTPYWLSGINQMGYIISKNDSIMQNGDSLKSSLWYQEMVITPNPGNINQFYVFHIGVTSTTNPGLYYSIVDLSYNSGLGRVIQKNVQLQNVEMCDGLTAVKHGNGKEWWLIAKRWDSLNNEFILYRITINGIIGPIIQNVGTPTSIGFLRIEFSNDGENIAVVNYRNLIELYHFDRCTGQITINHTVENEYLTGPYPGLWSCAFSVDNSKFYVTSILNGQNQDSSYLFQYDLNATNISASKDTLHTFISPSVAGILQLGPDARLYLSCSMEINDCEFAYLYCDTSYFPQNMNLSVINYPDSLGAACNFQPYSFYLGGHRTYYGLPNNPNYELGPWANSICDTLGVGIHELIATDEQKIYISPNPTKDIIWVNAQKLKGKKSQVVVRDILGQELFRKIEIVYGGYLSTNLDLSLFPDAVYLVTVETEKEKIVQRVVKD